MNLNSTGSAAFQQMMTQLATPSVAKPVKAKAVKAAPPARETKKSCAVRLYEQNIKQGKAAVIALYKSQLAMTDAGANSYFYAIKKQFTA